MHTLPHRSSKLEPSTVFDVLADGRRRRILATLSDRDEPVSERALAEGVGEGPGDGDRASSKERVALRHTHLPRLDDADLIEWDRESGIVVPTDLLHRDGLIERVVERATDAWDEALACLADDRRRTALVALAEADGPMTQSHLAREIAARAPDCSRSPNDVEDVEVSLHHRHLPRLADADLVTYDPEGGTVEFRAAPAVEELLTTVVHATH